MRDVRDEQDESVGALRGRHRHLVHRHRGSGIIPSLTGHTVDKSAVLLSEDGFFDTSADMSYDLAHE